MTDAIFDGGPLDQKRVAGVSLTRDNFIIRDKKTQSLYYLRRRVVLRKDLPDTDILYYGFIPDAQCRTLESNA